MSLYTADSNVNYYTFNVPMNPASNNGVFPNYVDMSINMYPLQFVPGPIPNPCQTQTRPYFAYPSSSTGPTSITPPALTPVPVSVPSSSSSSFSFSAGPPMAMHGHTKERAAMSIGMPLPASPNSLDSGSSPSASPRNLCRNHSHASSLSLSSNFEPIKHRHKLSIVLFDWDDTLYPTTRLINNKENVSFEQLHGFGKALYDLFQQFIKVYGDSNLYIITNSSKHWTLKSLKLCSKIYQNKASERDDREAQQLDYFAAIHNSLMSLKIRIISAQYLYAQKYPQKPSVWKIKAFKQITIEHFKNIKGVASGDNIIYEIVSIGDSENEFTASFEAKYKLNKFIKRRKSKNNIIRLHRVKLKKEPTMQEMKKQLEFLSQEASVMYSEPGSITIRYE